jgi:YfiH family protein
MALALLIPEWPAPPNVRALCTTRSGGVSTGRFEALNLGAHVGDAAAHVAENRARLQREAGVRPVFMQQVHGTAVAAVDADTPDGASADACTTTEANVACTIMVADCLPVLFTDEAGERVAAAHAGWRGLAGGVLEQTFKHFGPVTPVGHARVAMKVIAWLGPCIGPKAFEVGDEVRAAFEAHAPSAADCFKPGVGPGKWLADLAGLARQRLKAMGVADVYGNDSTDIWCTVNNASAFFSHRRDGTSGRFAALIWKG